MGKEGEQGRGNHTRKGRVGDRRTFEKPRMERKGRHMEAGEWGKSLRVEVSQESRDWMTEALDNPAKKCALCLEGTGRVSKVLTAGTTGLDLCGAAGRAARERRKAKERRLSCTGLSGSGRALLQMGGPCR